VNYFPTFPDHSQYYNINADELSGEPNDIGIDPSSILRSGEPLPRLTKEEIVDIRDAALRCLTRNEEIVRPTIDWWPLGTGEFWVSETVDDRTLEVELGDFRLLTPDLVESLQREVIAPRPLWRILLRGDVPESCIIVYPKGVWFQGANHESDWKAALPRLIALEKRSFELHKESRRRQLRYLRNKVPTMLAKLRTEPFVVIAVFDNWDGEPNRWPIWFLYSAQIDWIRLSLQGPKSGLAGQELPVRVDGTFGNDYTSFDAPYWLKEELLPAGFRGELVVEKQGEKRAVKGHWSVSFDSAWLVKQDAVEKGQ
jgi:hypothetical protein